MPNIGKQFNCERILNSKHDFFYLGHVSKYSNYNYRICDALFSDEKIYLFFVLAGDERRFSLWICLHVVNLGVNNWFGHRASFLSVLHTDTSIYTHARARTQNSVR